MPVEPTIDQLITEQALKFPDNVAIQFGNDSISYKNLHQKINQLANFLLANNITIGDKVAIGTARSLQMVVAVLAVTRVGGVYLPLDPNFPNDRLVFMLDDAQAKLVITSKIYEGHFHTPAAKLSIEDIWQKLDNYPATEPNISINGDDLAYLLYTSGSTGKPKGVQINHRSLLNLLLSIQKWPGITPQDTWLATATISFDISVLELFLPMVTGARLIVADSEMVKDGRLLLDIVRTQKVTVMQATPYTWRMMLASGWDDKIPLKIISGGEALPKDLANKLLERCDSLHNYYGPTETTIYSTGKQILADDQLITIGKPIDNTQVYILDEELKQVADGHEGEICIGGYGVGNGYLNRPELSDEKFIDDTFSGEANKKIYRTGDLGKILPNGEIEYLGRIDLQVKLRGFRIETQEVEYNLILQHGIQNAVVVVHNDEWDNQRLLAYVVSDDPLIASHKVNYSTTWIAGLKDKLPEYMVPTDYIVIPEIPLTPNGKIDRKKLPKPQFQNSQKEYEAPGSDTENMLAEIWSKYLHIDQIGINDNFFELGGHSLIAVQIMTGIGKITGKLIPIATLFKYPTISKLAQLLQSGDEESTWKSLVPIKPTGNKMPVYIIHGEGLNVLIFNNIAMSVDAEQPVYGLQSRGLNGIDEVPDSIEAIASLYIEEILEQNPTGPYAIAGYSFGGYVAIEIANQLQAMGKEVKILAMFDVNNKESESQLSLPKRTLKKILRQFYKAGFILTSLIKQPGATVEYQLFMIKQRLGMNDEANAENIPDYMQRIVDKLRYAVSRYKMKPYNGTIHVFRSKVRVYFVDDPKHLGWDDYALKGVKVHKVSGDHRDMLLPPNDVEFARILQNCLDNCES
ncbi:MAG: non-ribosomal peptide synthetase [Mucilaginibacter sp.]|uniref:non-ribosomal peptide synthetase n=1 Tax=Mucilaginibacter sp. TaxID=1882438 RepID=UPI003265EC76